MDWNAIDWPGLQRLRAHFLGAAPGLPDYWRSPALVASYDLTFAQRIGWKWDCLLGELRRRSWSPPPGDILDWACGSGIAGRCFLDHFGALNPGALRLTDRSGIAVQFAAQRARERFPTADIQVGASRLHPATLLVSHVLLELGPSQRDALLELARTAQCVLWIEPGTHQASHALIAVREQLRSLFRIVAPCVHNGPCGLLAPSFSHHWCHHFAPPPAAAFTDGDWARFAALMSIDLGSVPFSYLVLDRRPAPPPAPEAVRFLGRPRVGKAFARVLGCSANGIHERRIEKRRLPEAYRLARKGSLPPLDCWRCDKEVVVELGRDRQP